MPGGMGSGPGCGVIGCSGSGTRGGVAGLAGTSEAPASSHGSEKPTEMAARPSRPTQVLATLCATQKVCMAWEAAPHHHRAN